MDDSKAEFASPGQERWNIKLLSQAIYTDEPIKDIEQLIKNVSNINYSYKGIETPLTIALTKCNIEAAKLLIKNGADINWKNRDGLQPINFIPLNRKNISIQLFKLLIEKGATIGENKTFRIPQEDKKKLVKITEILTNLGAQIEYTDITINMEIPKKDCCYIL